MRKFLTSMFEQTKIDMPNVAKECEFQIEEIECDQDHIHLSIGESTSMIIGVDYNLGSTKLGNRWKVESLD